MIIVHAPLKLNCTGNVPATAPTLTVVRTPPVPPYACGAHTTVVADVHALLPHVSAAVSEAITDTPAASKLKPLIVTVPPAVGAAFAVAALTTGAASATLQTAQVGKRAALQQRTIEGETTARCVGVDLEPRLAPRTT
jgi:hypothetical protein